MKRGFSQVLSDGATSAIAAWAAKAAALGCEDEATLDLATALILAYPSLRAQILSRPEDVCLLYTSPSPRDS